MILRRSPCKPSCVSDIAYEGAQAQAGARERRAGGPARGRVQRAVPARRRRAARRAQRQRVDSVGGVDFYRTLFCVYHFNS